MKTLKSRLLFFILSAGALTLLVVLIFTQNNVDREINLAYEKNAINQLESVYRSIEAEYQGILFHKDIILSSRKEELKKLGEVAQSILSSYHKKVLDKELTLELAQKLAREELKEIRYDNGVGYYWINDIGYPYPKMIMHPTISKLDNKVLNDDKFNTVIDTNENLFSKTVSIVENNKEGYLSYLWPKPTSQGLTENQPKLSYVFLFEPWDWIVGSGVYINDIEEQYNDRLTAVIEKIRNNLDQIELYKTGYMFVFTEDDKTIYHPLFDYLFDISNVINPENKENLADQLRTASRQTENFLDYKWSKPTGSHNKLYQKRAYVRCFEPLRWYVASTFYISEMKEHGRNLTKNLIIISLVALFLSMLLIILLTSKITQPLSNLMRVAKDIEKKNDLTKKLPIKGSSEIRALSRILNQMLDSMRHHKEDLKKSERRLRALIENSSDGILMIDSLGNIILDNNKIAKNSENKPQKIFDYFRSDQKNIITENLDKTFRFGKNQTFQIHGIDEGKWYQISLGVIPTEEGFQNATVVITDITLIKRSKDQLSFHNERFKVVLDSIDAAIYVADPKTYEILFANKFLRDIWGPLIGKICWQALQKNQTGPCPFCTNDKLLNEQNKPTGIYHWQFKNTQNSRWYDVRDQMIKWTDGRLVRMEVAADISEIKQAEEKIVENLKEKEVLLKEIHHRVKNNIQIIYSLLKMQSRYIKNEEDRHLFDDSENRVRSMAIIHEQLYESENLAKINFEDYIKELTREMSIIFNDKAIIEINVSDVYLNINKAIPCGLIINELVSNSFKYSGKDGKNLKIKISFSHNVNEYFLSISDNGIGLQEEIDFDNLKSLGLQLIQALKKQIGAEMEIIRRPGATFTFRFKI